METEVTLDFFSQIFTNFLQFSQMSTPLKLIIL